ncbi:MAG: hypothetical protein AVDCRST_MAG06-3445, partial [uncultured Nocardioides sp.]
GGDTLRGRVDTSTPRTYRGRRASVDTHSRVRHGVAAVTDSPWPRRGPV